MAATERATERGDRPDAICCRTKASSACRSSASRRRSLARSELRQPAQIARVALERVLREAAFDPQMIQVRVDHRPGYANIRGFEGA